jgi:choline-glycine betaine transporter
MLKIKPLVFFPPFLLCAAFVALQAIDQYYFTETHPFVDTLVIAKNWVSVTFGWLVSLLSFALVVLCGAIYVSPFGRTLLGGPDAKRLLTPWQMFAVVLTTNIAAGILFWGVFEPAWHLSHPPTGIAPNSPEAAQFAISTVYLHWSLTPYAFASIVGLMFAFAFYNMQRPFSLGAPLAPLWNSRTPAAGLAAQGIDAVCLYCLVAGLTAALAGASQLLGGGIQHLLHIDSRPSNALIGAIIAAIMGASVIAAISGVTKGIRWIANVNTTFLIFFLGLVLVVGPTQFILDFAVEGLGQFLGQYPQKVLNTGAAHQDTWPHSWTQMYFSAFFAWAPIMGVFFGRIASGYTVRAFLFFNVVLPSLFTGVWMAVICGAVVHMDMIQHVDLAAKLDGTDPTKVLYAFLEHLGWAKLLVPVLLFTAFLSFVTTADGCTDTMSNISTRGISPEHAESSMFVKIAWGLLMGVLCFLVVTRFQLEGIRSMSTLGGFPALFLCLAIGVGAVRVMLNPAAFDMYHRDYAPLPTPKS